MIFAIILHIYNMNVIILFLQSNGDFRNITIIL